MKSDQEFVDDVRKLAQIWEGETSKYTALKQACVRADDVTARLCRLAIDGKDYVLADAAKHFAEKGEQMGWTTPVAIAFLELLEKAPEQSWPIEAFANYLNLRAEQGSPEKDNAALAMYLAGNLIRLGTPTLRALLVCAEVSDGATSEAFSEARRLMREGTPLTEAPLLAAMLGEECGQILLKYETEGELPEGFIAVGRKLAGLPENLPA